MTLAVIAGALCVSQYALTVSACLLHCRYEECKTKLTPFLKKVGFNPKTGIINRFVLYTHQSIEKLVNNIVHY